MINETLLINKKIEHFVYACGKSGSSSLHKSLPNSYHTHGLLYFIRQKLNDPYFSKTKIDYDLFDIEN